VYLLYIGTRYSMYWLSMITVYAVVMDAVHVAGTYLAIRIGST
jgi:hypothetical protein